MCRHVSWAGTSAVNTILESTKTFAFLDRGETLPTSLTDASYLPEATHVLYDEKDNMIGVGVRQNSKTLCYADGEADYYSFTAHVYCNKAINDDGGGLVIETKGLTTCNPSVHIEHKAGCYKSSGLAMINWFNKNVWLSGTVLWAFGALVAFKGNLYFKILTTLMYFFFSWYMLVTLMSLTGWPALPASRVLLSVGASLGISFGCFRAKKASVVSAGMIAGFLMGTFLYTLILALTNLKSFFLISFMAGVGTTVGGATSLNFEDQMRLTSTSFVGSYMFMRGWSWYFGGFPAERDIIMMIYPSEGGDAFNSIGWSFWLYMVFFFIVWGISYMWQVNNFSLRNMKEVREKLKGGVKFLGDKTAITVDDNFETATKKKLDILEKKMDEQHNAVLRQFH